MLILFVIYHIGKSKDYVYGIWVYKALGIWKGYYRAKQIMIFSTTQISYFDFIFCKISVSKYTRIQTELTHSSAVNYDYV